MKTNIVRVVVLGLMVISPSAYSQQELRPNSLSWDWFDVSYEVAYDNPYWEESREKSVWAGRAKANVGLAPYLHVTGSYDKQRFDADVGGVHTRETLLAGRYGLGTHVNLGPKGAFVLEALREEFDVRSHSDEAGSDPLDDHIVLRGFAYYAGLRRQLGSSELEIGYELATLKDSIAFDPNFEPAHVKAKFYTASLQLSAPLSKRLSAMMRFEQISSKGKVEQEALGVNDESSGHFENILFGLRFSL